MLRWLFQRSKATYAPTAWRERRIHEQIAADLAAYPGMCEPEIDMPTMRITLVIDQGRTLASTNDPKRTRTMETVVIFAR